jgi:hypothetical protein
VNFFNFFDFFDFAVKFLVRVFRVVRGSFRNYPAVAFFSGPQYKPFKFVRAYGGLWVGNGPEVRACRGT